MRGNNFCLMDQNHRSTTYDKNIRLISKKIGMLTPNISHELLDNMRF